jgi:hypothetical protein
VNSVYKSEARKYQWYQFKNFPNDTFDIIYAGNSHSFMGVMPKVIEDLLGLSGYDLGISAEELKTTYYGLKEMYQTQSPKYVVLETYVIELNMTDIKGYYFGFTDSIKFDQNVLKVVLDSYSLNDVYQYYPFVRTHAKIWKSPEVTFDLLNNYFLPNENYDLIRFYQTNGFEKNDSQIRISEIENLPQDFPIRITEMDSQTTYYFEKIIDLCHQNGSKLILLTMPGMKNIILKEGVDLDYAAIAEKYQLDYIELPNDFYSTLHYSDYTHLTEFGALKATLDIVQELSKILNLQYSDQLFNQYSQMVVANYNFIKIDEEVYLLELLSDHNNFSSNTVTSLFKLDGRLAGSWSKNNNQFYFFDIGTGEYRTRIEIYNPNIDFKISQNVFVNIP